MNIMLQNSPVVRLPNAGARFRMCKGLCFNSASHQCKSHVITIIVTNRQRTQSTCEILGCGLLDLATLAGTLTAFARERFPASTGELGFAVAGIARWTSGPASWPRFGVTRAVQAVLHKLHGADAPRGVPLIAAFPTPGAPVVLPATTVSPTARIAPSAVPTGMNRGGRVRDEPAELAAVDDATLELYGAVDAMRTSFSLSPQTDRSSAATDATDLMDAAFSDAVSDLSPLYSDNDDDDDGRSFDVDGAALKHLAAAWRSALTTNAAIEPAAAAVPGTPTTTTTFELQTLATRVGLAALSEPSHPVPPSELAAGTEGHVDAEPKRVDFATISFSVTDGYPLRRFDRTAHDVASYCRGDLYARGLTSFAARRRPPKEEKDVAAERRDAWAELRGSSHQVRRCRRADGRAKAQGGTIAVPGVAMKMRLAKRGVGTIGDDRPAVIASRRRLADARR